MYSCQFISSVVNSLFSIVKENIILLRKNSQMTCLLNTNTTGCKISSSYIYYQLRYLQIQINSQPLERVTYKDIHTVNSAITPP